MNYGEDYKYIPATSVASGSGMEVLPDLYQFTVQIVNIQMVGLSGEEFVLIDAGMPKSVSTIMKAVEERFGENSRPKAIVLTHGHFDHVGALIVLIEHCVMPAYSDPLVIPYITGEISNPKPDASVEGGLVANTAAMFPNDPIDTGENAYILPDNGTVPALAEFKWLHA